MCMCAFVYVHTHTNTHARKQTLAYKLGHTHTHTPHTHTRKHTHTYTRARAYALTRSQRAHTHTHTHTHTSQLVQLGASERVSRVIWFSSGLQSVFRESIGSVRSFRARFASQLVQFGDSRARFASKLVQVGASERVSRVNWSHTTHTHTPHTQTHVGFYGLRGLSIGVMVFILYKLYVLLPYTYPTPKLSPHRRRCISIFPQKNSLCMIYKHFKLWGH